MNIKNLKYNLILILLLFISVQVQLYSDYKGNIYNVNTASDTVDMGICYVTDSLLTEFKLESLGSDSLYLPLLTDYYFHSATENDPNGIFKFFYLNEPPFTILPKSSLKYLLQFNNKFVSDNEGRFEMRLKMILSKSKNPTSISNDSVFGREFIIISRKTKKYIAGYDSTLNFDSVFVNSSQAIIKNWFIKNVWTDNLSVFGDKFQLITSKLSNDEIKLSNRPLNFPINLASRKDNPAFEFSYLPLNKGEDSAYYEIYFHPDEKGTPPNNITIDTTKVLIRGVGVEQKLSYKMLSNNDVNFDNNLKAYVIDAGNIKVNSSSEIKFIIKNDGNLNFGILNQSIQNSRGDVVEIIDSVISYKHIKPLEIDTFTFKIIPKSFGKIDAFISLKSDIINRKIYGYQKSDEEIKIYITGIGIEPKLSISADTLNFGNVSKSDSCPSYNNLNLKLINYGNDDLEFKDIYIENNNLSTFTYANPSAILGKGLEFNMNIKFEPKDLIVYNSILVLVTNQSSPKDTLKVRLLGSGTERISANLTIDSIRSAPARTIDIPIKIDKNKTQLSNRFEDILLFNPTLLDFQGLISNNTASDGLSIGSISDKRNDGLHLVLKRLNNAYFLNSDTLIILRFKTYLGNAESTYLTFTDPKFADNLCSQVLKPILSKGLFTLDSVCGLEKKIGDLPKGFFNILSTNFNEQTKLLHCKFEVPFKSNVKFNLYQIDGIKIHQIDNNIYDIGENEINFPSLNLSSGIYLLQMQSGIFNSVKQILIYD